MRRWKRDYVPMLNPRPARIPDTRDSTPGSFCTRQFSRWLQSASCTTSRALPNPRLTACTAPCWGEGCCTGYSSQPPRQRADGGARQERGGVVEQVFASCLRVSTRRRHPLDALRCLLWTSSGPARRPMHRSRLRRLTVQSRRAIVNRFWAGLRARAGRAGRRPSDEGPQRILRYTRHDVLLARMRGDRRDDQRPGWTSLAPSGLAPLARLVRLFLDTTRSGNLSARLDTADIGAISVRHTLSPGFIAGR